ncbi:hypothetical protein [Gordonia polyisoprenivorans]|uniref:hypothetical protein n=1 Tax=Gordonia polyisoprenivorans TaxID=84595 RepID=UPI001AD664CB|nr:hypothetical protein [Gordonia polyisoprenivorans]QTI67654.1 hypothetical protein J6U32_19040 [Gordonia polyisoprenivorans]
MYVTAQDVQSRYLGGEIPDEEWLDIRVPEAEALLLTLVPRLQGTVTDLDKTNIVRVVSDAVIRLFDNPRGITREQIEEQSWQLASGQSADTAGRIHFTADDLRVFRKPIKRFGYLHARTITR